VVILLQWNLVDLSGRLLLGSLSCSVVACFAFLLHVSPCTLLSSGQDALTRSSVGCFGLGFILDMKHVSQRRRAQIGLFTVVILNLGVYIWSIIMQARFNASSPGKIDWDDALYPTAFLPYFFVQTTGPLSQSYMYWLLSSFATDAQGEFVLVIRLSAIY
jgi:hypothetical protein